MQSDVAERALSYVVETDVEELGEAVVLLLLGDGRGEERGTCLVPEREGEHADLGGIRMEAAVVAVAGGDGGQDDGDVREGDVDRGVSPEVEHGALGWSEADAHHLEVKASACAGADGEGAG